MKKIVLTLSAVVALATSVIANQIQVGYSGSSYGPYQTGAGGEFTFNDVNPEGWLDLSGYVPGKTSNFGPRITSFQTFCIEIGESLKGYAAIYDAAISTGAINGGVAGGNPDVVSEGTGWLYSQFARGTLGGYNYNGGRLASAAALQEAIWWLEQEINSYNAANPFMQAVIGQFGSAAAARVDGGWKYGVFAVNMTGLDGGIAQDGLWYRVPDGGLTLALLGFALVGVGALRRKLKG